MKRSPVAIILRKGAWAAEEDILLRQCIEKFGEGKWHQVPHKAGLNRCRKSCRLRWLNYLRPNIKRGEFTVDEVDLMIRLHKLLGNRWSLIAGRLPGRTANDVKNYWNSHLQKKLDADSRLVTVKKSKSKKEVLLIEAKTNCLSCACHNNTLIKPHPRTFSKNTSVSLGTQSSDAHKNNDNNNNNNTTNNVVMIQSPQLVQPPPRVPVADDWWTKLLVETTTIDHDNQDQIDGEGFELGDLMMDDSTPQTICGVQDLGQTGWTDIWNLLNAD